MGFIQNRTLFLITLIIYSNKRNQKKEFEIIQNKYFKAFCPKHGGSDTGSQGITQSEDEGEKLCLEGMRKG